jgi:hypothetical protein
METTNHSTSVLALQAAQSIHLELDAGASVVLLRGAAAVCGPAEWLGGTVVLRHTVLQEGQGYAAPQGGAVQLRARTDCRFVVLRGASAWTRLARWLREAGASRPTPRAAPMLR